MEPPAPGLFSITTGWPSACESLSQTTRVITSVGPPAGNGTTIFTGRAGYDCACASTLAAPRRMQAIRRVDMACDAGLRRRANGSIGPREVVMGRGISALVFDAYGTLFDVHSVTRLAESHFPGRGAALSAAWRTKQLEYAWLRTLMGRYEDFNRVTLAALEWSLESLGLEASEAVRDALHAEYRRLALFPEVRATLATLAARRPLAILSNGHPEMLEAV